MFNLFTKVRSTVPKKRKLKDEGIYSNFIYSDFYYGLYERESYFYDHENINLYSKIDKIKANQLDIYSRIKSININSLNIYSNISQIDNSLNLYSKIEEKKENQNISFYSRINESSASTFDFYSRIKCSDFRIAVFDSETNQSVSDINWEFYRKVGSSQILIDSSLSSDGIINIFLNNYNLQDINSDYFIRVWKAEDIYNELNIDISYYKDFVKTRKCHYLNIDSYLKKEGESKVVEKIVYKGSSAGGPVTYTSSADVKIKTKLIYQSEENILCDFKEKIRVKSKLVAVDISNIEVRFEGVSNV